MKSVFLENKGHYHTSVNGNVIDQAKWNVDYDGKTANLEAEKNGNIIYMKLTNDEIMKIMGTSASPYSLQDRLLYDKQHKPHVSPILLKMHNESDKKGKSRKSKSTRKHRTKTHGRSKSKSKSKSMSKSKSSTNKQKIPDYMQTIY